jgi:pimeloyl-ACP methyl ester carboxylesterase
MAPYLICAGVMLAAIFQSVATTLIPPPTGSYNTSLATSALIDYSRLDPFAPTPQYRALMVSVFNPVPPAACSPSVAPYMVSKTAEFEDAQFAQFGILPGTFESFEFQVCQPITKYKHALLAQPHPPETQSSLRQTFPVILFSGGLGETRLFYSIIAQQLSSTGYTVITIDHPYDANIVTFPDNSTIFAANITTDDQIVLSLNTRAKDISFVLDQLSRTNVTKPLISTLAPDVSRAGVFGHSLGGAAAAEATLYDSRLAGCINLDGTFWGDVVETGLKKPILIFAHEGKNLTTDPSWEAIWPKLTGWKRELMLAGSQHGTFTDLPDLVDILGIGAELPGEVTKLLGTIDGRRAFDIVTTYVQAFFDFVLKGKKSDLLDSSSLDYPEVSFGGF